MNTLIIITILVILAIAGFVFYFKKANNTILKFEDAKTIKQILRLANRPQVPRFRGIPQNLRPYFRAQYKAVCIAEAANGSLLPDWKDSQQYKYFPWYRMLPAGGVVYYNTFYFTTLAFAGDAARLAFLEREKAEYAGQTFPDIYEELLTK